MQNLISVDGAITRTVNFYQFAVCVPELCTFTHLSYLGGHILCTSLWVVRVDQKLYFVKGKAYMVAIGGFHARVLEGIAQSQFPRKAVVFKSGHRV